MNSPLRFTQHGTHINRRCDGFAMLVSHDYVRVDPLFLASISRILYAVVTVSPKNTGLTTHPVVTQRSRSPEIEPR